MQKEVQVTFESEISLHLDVSDNSTTLQFLCNDIKKSNNITTAC